MMNIQDLIEAAENVSFAEGADVYTGGGSSKPSFGIVNPTGNSKRLSFSKALAGKLELEDTAMVIPVAVSGIVMIGKTLPFPKARKVTLHASGKRCVAYDAGVVGLITREMQLTFGKHVSMSFDNISFETLPTGEMVAVVAVYDKYATSGSAAAHDDAAGEVGA